MYSVKIIAALIARGQLQQAREHLQNDVPVIDNQPMLTQLQRDHLLEELKDISLKQETLK